jgi:hypothetical protein
MDAVRLVGPDLLGAPNSPLVRRVSQVAKDVWILRRFGRLSTDFSTPSVVGSSQQARGGTFDLQGVPA